jgi:alpha-D-ribose 1-methylphosphonate 5-triphosphate diphosphatase
MLEQGIRALTNARVVTPAAVIEGASIILEQGRIAGVLRRAERARRGRVDVGGCYVLPGLVDLHSDALETHGSPRPHVAFDPTLVFLEVDRYFACAGVTTGFHAICFYDGMWGMVNAGRSVARARTFL